MIRITWDRENDYAVVNSSKIGVFEMPVSCIVRNEMNGWRPNPKKDPKKEVVYGITRDNRLTDIPVMPRRMPLGVWNIIWIEARTNKAQRPFIIMTDAHQLLDVWSLDENGGYKEKTGRTFDDWMYGIHLSAYNTTQGCIKAHSEKYFNILADLVFIDKRRGEEMILVVVDGV